MQIKIFTKDGKMEKNPIYKLILGGQIVLAAIMFTCMSLGFGYHLFAGNLNLVTFACFLAMWIISYKMLVWSVADWKTEKANQNI